MVLCYLDIIIHFYILLFIIIIFHYCIIIHIINIPNDCVDFQKNYTIVIVTHNMQQASRVADYTAFFHLGNLIEYGLTSDIFVNPKKKKTEDYITGRFG